jgi:Reverse transcriptase (RNA-dependent DNA polymerase)/Endonuclease-reverse transcriptase
VRGADKNCIIIGDFNLPTIDWEGGAATGRASELLEAAEDRLLEQMVQFSTHVRGNRLDLLLTDIPERVSDVTEEGPLGASDHVMLLAHVVVRPGPAPALAPSDRGLPDWRRAYWEAMRREMRACNWNERLYRQNAEQEWSTLKGHVHELISRHVPDRRRRNHNRPPWLTRDILRAIRRKKKLWRAAKSGQQVEEYKVAEKQAKNMIRNAKRSFERGIAKGCGSDQANKKRFFAYVRQKTKARPGVGPLKDVNGRIVQDNGEMAALLNNFFSSVFTREDTTNILDPETTGCRSTISDVKITAKEVKGKIKKLRTDGAAGPDGMGPLLLKELVEEISWPLAKIMRTSLQSGEVPEDWRTANMTPIYKKGARTDPGNYRPVSLTTVCCRVMESIMKDQIVTHLERNGLINKSQHGFMTGRSCTTNLLVFLEKVTAELDKGEPVDVIYLDFAKAFDTVPHERLKRKLKAHGIGGGLLKWIAAWLRSRKQRVVLNGKESTWEDVLSGVPQGSVLGPLLFLLFINDLDSAVSLAEALLKFADDTKLARVVKNEEDRRQLQAALDDLIDWSRKWGMAFNVKKCKLCTWVGAMPGVITQWTGLSWT